MKAVVLQSAFIGDVLFTLPLIEALAASERYEAVAVAATPAGGEMVRLHGRARPILDDKRGGDAGPLGVARVCARLRAFAGGAPLDVYAAHRSARTALVALGSGAERRIGFADAALARLAYGVRAPRERRDVDAYLSLARAAGVGAVAAAPRIEVTGEARRAAEARLGPGRPRLGLVLGSRRATKDWPEERLVEAVCAARAHGFARVCLLGGPAERARAARVRAAAVAATRGAAVAVHADAGGGPNGRAGASLGLDDATGEPLADAGATLAVLDAVIGPDSGLTHLARAVGTPAVVLFGPTDERRHALGPRARALVNEALGCRPCHHAGPRRCPLGHHACMRALGGAQAVAAAAALL